MFKNLKLKDYDFKLIIFVVSLNIIGILAVSSANSSYTQKMLLGSVLGFFMMIVISLFDYKIILRFYWVWYLFAIGMLVLVLLAGESGGGATRWFEIAGIRFQPSEMVKIILIIFFAQFIMKYKDRINSIVFLISFILLAGVPVFLVVSQPDLSNTIVITVIILMILFVGGISWKYVVAAFAVFVPSVIVFLSIVLKEGQTLIDNYQRKRILSFIYPEKYVDDAYQQTNSIIAIGSGQLLGKGLNNNEISSLKNGSYIIQPETDFIFAVIGEELGFLGTALVILLFFLVVIECLMIARKTTDLAGRLIAVGMGTLIGIQSFFNIGVATFILPNTGLTLPFVSYGLTSIVSLYIGMGFVLNVGLRSRVLKDKDNISFF